MGWWLLGLTVSLFFLRLTKMLEINTIVLKLKINFHCLKNKNNLITGKRN